jgi:hypothetical protein
MNALEIGKFVTTICNCQNENGISINNDYDNEKIEKTESFEKMTYIAGFSLFNSKRFSK